MIIGEAVVRSEVMEGESTKRVLDMIKSYIIV